MMINKVLIIVFFLVMNTKFVLANNDVPDKDSDEYANYVITRGAGQQLTYSQIVALSSAISRSVVSSYGSIVDRHTAAAIEYTLIDALFNSPTFQNSVAFGLNNNIENVGHILFTNEYEINEEREGDFSDVDDVEIDDIEDSDANQVPIFASHEAREDDNGTPVVNIGAAPRIDSNEYPWWQEALIHEVIHHITDSSDTDEVGRHGPTEILAQRIANELHWPIPTFKGYADPERTQALKERNFQALLHTIDRHPSEAEALLNRLATISRGLKASARFSLLTSFCSSGIIDLPKLPDFDDDDFSMGAAFFTGASASNLGECSLDAAGRVDPVSSSITFEGGQLLIQRDLKNLNLLVAKLAFLRAKNKGGFYSKNWESWKHWYKDSGWKHLFGYGIYGYGLEEAEGNDLYNPYGLTFNDGSFSIGVVGQDVKESTSSDNFTKLSGTNWHTIKYAGQMFFDRNGRPVALVITDALTGGFGSGWSFIYNNGKWQYESKDDWDVRLFQGSTLSLDPYAPKFSTH
ncbi:M85 family metallopeptidase [Grimontia sp. NTOU-MAR1]|uniref:M85 family metallopeptidase n=1 Tax=Grimontia sp. NTOU-MAR1 TaxID=3111011 RepID=UPI002DBDBE79|nr:M85 family metallopeptidase [Grimontia sp. NTOU-MAR1]WRV99049.1 M85 family metallopeptidase [Grimontia sp. NTOU-MAR1]